MNLTVSIIIPCYNKKAYLGDTLDSILAQSTHEWELILIDDNSNDGTQNIIKSYAKKCEKITPILNGTNKGANSCRNQGIKLAKGDYILFFDADDLMTPSCIENRIEIIRQEPNFDLWVFNMGIFRSTQNDISSSEFWWLKQWSNEETLNLFIKHQLPWQTMQPVWKKEFVQKLDGFNITYQRLQDVELHTRALLVESKLKICNESTIDIYYRIDNERLTDKKNKFYTKFVDACIQYYGDFYPLLNPHKKKLLGGTLFEALSIINYQKRIGTIDSSNYRRLIEKILSTIQSSHQLKLFKLYIWIEKITPFHPKGLKFIFKKLLKLN
ncbi:glycosyltransferase family 2 protein [Crocinitomix algicola]|uniref:glycosyltransferase family 2 protein n=1 Tax=Crocinitomix algicola TaxID=1740263 RepID=UPI00083489CD|nr:glycosyltransferase family 2 protein [Crocinitomix algicola]